MENKYPNNDNEFEETTVGSVSKAGDGWQITRADGWSFFVPANSIEPKTGMVARFYGRGIGYTVRGLFLDGKEVFYRTESQEKEHGEIESYGADAADWLKRWDEGKSVWSIEMGGMGPGYEQAIQITAAEVLRHLLEAGYDHTAWSSKDQWNKDLDAIREAGFANETIKKMGISGAMWGGALSLATQLYRRGPRAIMSDEAVKNRHIQVCRKFPT